MTKGIVSNITANDTWKPGTTLHSFRLADDASYYNCGTEAPPVKRGELVEFDGTEKSPGKIQVDLGSIKVLKEATTEVKQPFKGGWKSGGYKKDDAKEGYWRDREARDVTTQQVIQLQSSRNSAIAAATLILDNGGLDLEKVAKGKKKEVIEALIDSLTEKFEQQASDKRSGGGVVRVEVRGEEVVKDQAASSEDEWK